MTGLNGRFGGFWGVGERFRCQEGVLVGVGEGLGIGAPGPGVVAPETV